MAAPTPLPIRFTPGSDIRIDAELPDGPVSLQFLADSGGTSDAGQFGTETQVDVTLARHAQLLPPLDFTYGASEAKRMELHRGWRGSPSFGIGATLNSIDEIRAAGTVKTEEMEPGLFEVEFIDLASKTLIGMTSPTLGDLASRVTEERAGDGTFPEIQRIDLRVKNVATIATGDISAISAGTITASIINAGTASEPQVEQIDMGELAPEGGAFAISIDGGSTYTTPIALPASAYTVHAALDALSEGAFRVAMSKQGRRFTVTRTANGVIANALTVQGAARWPEGMQGTLEAGDLRRRIERYAGPITEPVECILSVVTGSDLSDRDATVERLLTARFNLLPSGQAAILPPVLVE